MNVPLSSLPPLPKPIKNSSKLGSEKFLDTVSLPDKPKVLNALDLEYPPAAEKTSVKKNPPVKIIIFIIIGVICLGGIAYGATQFFNTMNTNLISGTEEPTIGESVRSG